MKSDIMKVPLWNVTTQSNIFIMLWCELTNTMWHYSVIFLTDEEWLILQQSVMRRLRLSNCILKVYDYHNSSWISTLLYALNKNINRNLLSIWQEAWKCHIWSTVSFEASQQMSQDTTLTKWIVNDKSQHTVPITVSLWKQIKMCFALFITVYIYKYFEFALKYLIIMCLLN